MNKLLGVLWCLVLCSTAAAQKAEIFGGYSLLHFNPGPGLHATNLNGWNAALTGKFNKFIGITADFNGVYGNTKVDVVCIAAPCVPRPSSQHVYTFLFGPQVEVPAGKLAVFGHSLFGVAHSGTGLFNLSDHAVAIGLGGGLDYKLATVVGLRVAQVDYVHTGLRDIRQNQVRYSGGIVLRF